MHKKAVLVITDGIGYSQHTTYNAFYHAKKPTYDYLFENVPYAMIHTYGLSVGLPEEQMGNSEVGHMCIGSGRVLYQDLVKISLALENGEIQHNKAFLHVADSCEDIHLCGLMSDGGVHSHLSHLLGLATICATKNKRVWLHLITDGRDVLPQSALEYLNKVQHAINAYPNIHIATLSGRFYAMDRDKRWDRIESAYNAIVCADNTTTKTPQEYIQSQYKQEIFDEFMHSIKSLDNKNEVIINYEIGLTERLISAGFKANTYIKALYRFNHVILSFWRLLIERYNMPFVKSSILRHQNDDLTTTVFWQECISSNTDYPVSLIEENLSRTSLEYKPVKFVPPLLKIFYFYFIGILPSFLKHIFRRINHIFEHLS